MSHRTTARLLPVALGASLTVIAPAAGAEAAPTSADVQRESVALDAFDESGRTEQLDTRDFRVAGVTWEGHRTDVQTSVRTRDADTGDWSGWTALDPEGGPAAAASDESTRGGTEPLITEDSDGIQVRVESPGQRPDDLTVDVIDPGTSPADAEATPATVTSPQATSTETEAATARPTVRSRAAWGADESMRRGDPEYGEVRGAVVHHTAETNDYTKAEVPEIIRGIYDYHVNSHGWNDIGYNVLVDKWGRLWEGRAGGLDQAVMGAHALGVNDETTGISALGNYDEVAAPDAMTAGIERYLAWKLDLHGVDPTGTATLNGEQHKTIIGHRDVNSTICPGQYLAERLPEIRSGAKARQS